MQLKLHQLGWSSQISDGSTYNFVRPGKHECLHPRHLPRGRDVNASAFTRRVEPSSAALLLDWATNSIDTLSRLVAQKASLVRLPGRTRQLPAMTEEGELVQLYIYDLSQGLAARLSLPLLGRWVEAIYHTSVVVGGVETYYGRGILEASPGSTHFGRPIKVLNIGRTQIPAEIRQEFLIDVSERYSPEKYSLISNNCNNFSDEFMQFLTGQGVPPHITGLPAEIFATPFGQQLLPMLSNLEAAITAGDQQQHAITRQGSQPSSPQAVPSLPLVSPTSEAVNSTAAAVTSPTTASFEAQKSERSISGDQASIGPSAAHMSSTPSSQPSVATNAATSAGSRSPNQVLFHATVAKHFARLTATGVAPNQAVVQALMQALQSRSAVANT